MSDRDQVSYWREKLKIDRHSLDVEVIRQPSRFFDVCEKLVMAISRKDQANDALKAVSAEISLEVRRQLEKVVGKDKKPVKVTEGRVDAEIRQRPEFQSAKEAWLLAVRDAELWQAMKEAYMQRGWMLKELSNLYASNYFSTPAARGPADATATYTRASRPESSQRKRLKLENA
jgi:hypothetical protein